MVDAISSLAARMRALQTGEDAGTSRPAAVEPARLGQSDEVRLGPSLKASLPTGIEEGPPFDLTAVAEIKDAIRAGNYPIDREKIADRLFQSYYELTL